MFRHLVISVANQDGIKRSGRQLWVSQFAENDFDVGDGVWWVTLKGFLTVLAVGQVASERVLTDCLADSASSNRSGSALLLSRLGQASLQFIERAIQVIPGVLLQCQLIGNIALLGSES